MSIFARLWSLMAFCRRSTHNWLQNISARFVSAHPIENQTGDRRKPRPEVSASSPMLHSPHNQSTAIPPVSQPSQWTSTQPRPVNLTQQLLQPDTKSVLEKGFNFGITQNISPKLLSLTLSWNVEVGMDRTYVVRSRSFETFLGEGFLFYLGTCHCTVSLLCLFQVGRPNFKSLGKSSASPQT